MVGDPNPVIRTCAKETIAQMGPPTKDNVPIYAVSLREPPPELRIYAAGRLAELGRASKSELVFLRILALDKNAEVQEAAQKATQRIEGEVLASLTAGLKTSHPRCAASRRASWRRWGQLPRSCCPV